MRAENAIRGTNISRTVQEKYGNDRRRYDRIIRDMVCGVVPNRAILLRRAADRASPPGSGPTDLTAGAHTYARERGSRNQDSIRQPAAAAGRRPPAPGGSTLRRAGSPYARRANRRAARRTQRKKAASYHRKGVNLSGLGKYGEAVARFEEALERDPDHAEAHWEKGVALYRMGEDIRASASLDRAMELGPGDAAAYCDRGARLQNLGIGGKAAEYLERAIRLDPGNPAAYYNRGMMLMDGGIRPRRSGIWMSPSG